MVEHLPACSTALCVHFSTSCCQSYSTPFQDRPSLLWHPSLIFFQVQLSFPQNGDPELSPRQSVQTGGNPLLTQRCATKSSHATTFVITSARSLIDVARMPWNATSGVRASKSSLTFARPVIRIGEAQRMLYPASTIMNLELHNLLGVHNRQ